MYHKVKKPSKDSSHYELVYEPHLTLKTLHLATQLICGFHAIRTANAHFCQQNSLFGFCNKGDVCLLWIRNRTCMRVSFEDEREKNMGIGSEKATVLQRKWGTIFDSSFSCSALSSLQRQFEQKVKHRDVKRLRDMMWSVLAHLTEESSWTRF
jgi:hypothetical protein